MREWYRTEAAAKGKGGGEILIYGPIGKRWWDEDAVGAKDFLKELQGLVDAGPGDIHVRINSPGGDVADGMAIYNALRGIRNRVVCTIDSVAYSMASVIALAGRTTRMQDTGQYMIHNPIVGVYGSEKELESALKALRTAKAVLMKAYQGKTGKSEDDISQMMGATSWMTAEEAKEAGFVDEVIEEDATALAGIAACFDAGAWARWYRGEGPAPMDNVDEVDGAGEVDTPPVVEDNGGDAPEEKRMPKLTAKEIREACPEASAAFLLAQIEACDADENRGLVDVLKAHNAEQAKALAAANAKAAEAAATAEAEAAKTPVVPAKKIGVSPIASNGTAGEGGGDPVEDYNDAVAALESKGKTRAQAIRDVAVNQPEVHAAYIRAHNAEYRRPAGRFGI